MNDVGDGDLVEPASLQNDKDIKFWIMLVTAVMGIWLDQLPRAEGESVKVKV